MNTITINKPLFAEETIVGKGAVFKLNQVPPVMIKFLRLKYQEDPSCLKGDIDFLFKFEGLPIDDEDTIFDNYKYFLMHVWNGKRLYRTPKKRNREEIMLKRKIKFSENCNEIASFEVI